LDVLCLQETKLQESHLDDPKVKLNNGNLIEGYDAYWSCSTAKKGYAGTAVFVKQRSAAKKKQAKMGDFFASNKNASSKAEATICTDLDSGMIQKLVPTNVSYKMGKEAHDAEGRIITLDFPLFSFSNVYVPNSGQKLERLTYRTQEWDKDLLRFMQTKQSDRGCPVIWLGDLNVAHTNLEVWNDGAKHLPKQAATTPEERQSFQDMLDAGFVDAFRKLHPTAQGNYSYWSQRSGNREPNKGLRLDVSLILGVMRKRWRAPHTVISLIVIAIHMLRSTAYAFTILSLDQLSLTQLFLTHR
jgi:exodeoxyribonuclease III